MIYRGLRICGALALAAVPARAAHASVRTEPATSSSATSPASTVPETLPAPAPARAPDVVDSPVFVESTAPPPVAEPGPAPPDGTVATPTVTAPVTPAAARSQDPTSTPTSPTTTKPERPRNPRLVGAAGPTIGPHMIGNEECRPSEGVCEKTGTFFGFGAQAEVRGRLYRFLYAHARVYASGNVSPNSRVYRGAWGLAAGLGVYSRHVFGRAEYTFIDPFGSNQFAPPFFSAAVGKVDWGHHAGALVVGFRYPFRERLGVELWGGPMFGPKSVRSLPQTDPDKRTLITFMIGLSLTYDLVQ